MDIQSVSSFAQVGSAPSGGNAAPAPSTAAASSAASSQAASPPPTNEGVKQAVAAINDTIKSFTRDVEFATDSDSKSTVVKVMDNKTGEVIRQIPSEEVLTIAKALDKLQGLIIRQKA